MRFFIPHINQSQPVEDQIFLEHYFMSAVFYHLGSETSGGYDFALLSRFADEHIYHSVEHTAGAVHYTRTHTVRRVGADRLFRSH